VSRTRIALAFLDFFAATPNHLDLSSRYGRKIDGPIKILQRSPKEQSLPSSKTTIMGKTHEQTLLALVIGKFEQRHCNQPPLSLEAEAADRQIVALTGALLDLGPAHACRLQE
jgi:hypothetical protein